MAYNVTDFSDSQFIPSDAINYGTGAYMPGDKSAGMEEIKTALKDVTSEELQTLYKNLIYASSNPSHASWYEKGIGYPGVYSKDPSKLWSDWTSSTNTQDNLARMLWEMTPNGTFWQANAGLGPDPGWATESDPFNELFATVVTTGLGIAGGVAGGALLGPTIGAAAGAGAGAGMTSGFISGTQNGDVLGSMASGGILGGLTGAAVGGITSGIDNAIGYNSTGADAIWSESATPLSSSAATTGLNTVTGAATGAAKSALTGGDPLTGAITGGVSSGVNSAISSTSDAFGLPDNSIVNYGEKLLGSAVTGGVLGDLFGTSSNSSTSSSANITGSTGSTNMATTDTGSYDWSSILGSLGSAYNTYDIMGNTSDTYDKAYDLITTPSADQQMYRDQLSKLMSDPGSMSTSPLYQAMADEGMNAVNRTSAAKQMLGSGNRLTELNKVGQDTASKYYFPQAALLSSLSGVTGDSGVRASGAKSLIAGLQAQNDLQNNLSDDLSSALLGTQTPEQQLLNALTGKTTSTGGSLLNTAISKGSDWFNEWLNDPANYSEASSIMNYLDPYGASSLPDTGISEYMTPTADYVSSLYDNLFNASSYI